MTNGNGDSNQKTMTIIVTKGTLDWAYPPFILGTTAAAMGVNVTMFFTFYGLSLLLKKLDLQISPLGNPAMKMPMMGMHMGMPNIVGVLPGVDAVATMMMKNLIKKKGVASIEELREAAIDSDINLVGLPDDDGPVRIQARGHDRRHHRRRRRDLHGKGAQIRHQPVHLTTTTSAENSRA